VNDVLVLCYHAVSPDWPAALSTTPELLEAHLRLLAGRGYRGATFTDVVTGPPPAGRVAVITFDDAYRSILTRARPILAAHGFPATVFVPTDWVGRDEPMAWPGIDRWLGGPHEPDLYPLDWKELAELADDGWEVGSHSCSHPRLTALDDAALDRELGLSRALVERHLDRPCSSFAYPYGDVDDRVAGAARRAGYTTGAALARRLSPLGVLRVPRVGIYRADTRARFRIKISPLGRRLRAHVG
jgi:peptidoglycan/xylan/chitin deacetylase (PgdA/CDA1 family)